MAQSRCFSIIGDSNLKRFVTIINRRACPDLDSAQILTCGKSALFAQALQEVRDEVDTCVIACLSNFLASAPGTTGSGSGNRVEPVLLDVQKKLWDMCAEHPDRKFLVCPPMYRSSPLWYRDDLPDVLKKFSFVMMDGRPSNLLLMPSFSSPVFESDGIHLSAASGLEYLFFLFDSARETLRRDVLEVPELTNVGMEATRVLEDRMMAIEQDHKRLSQSFEYKTAIYAERDDFQENVRNEVFFMISGLRPIQNLRGRDWMNKAIEDVQKVVKVLIGREVPIVVVHNATGRGRDAEVRYSVRLSTAAESQEIRSKFGSFFVGGQDRRPEALRGISISNKITPGTQIRIMILKLLAKRYTTSNPGSSSKVIGYEPRPILKLTPPESATSRRVQNYTYIEAIKKLPTNFTPEEVKNIIAKARVNFAGNIRSTFVVLSDDAAPTGRFPRRTTGANPDQPVQDAPSRPTEARSSTIASESEAEADEQNIVEDISTTRSTRKRPNPSNPSGVPGSQRSRR